MLDLYWIGDHNCRPKTGFRGVGDCFPPGSSAKDFNIFSTHYPVCLFLDAFFTSGRFRIYHHRLPIKICYHLSGNPRQKEFDQKANQTGLYQKLQWTGSLGLSRITTIRCSRIPTDYPFQAANLLFSPFLKRPTPLLVRPGKLYFSASETFLKMRKP